MRPHRQSRGEEETVNFHISKVPHPRIHSLWTEAATHADSARLEEGGPPGTVDKTNRPYVPGPAPGPLAPPRRLLPDGGHYSPCEGVRHTFGSSLRICL